MLIKFIPLLIGAYLLGSVPTAYLIARWRRKIDIRQYGSGNVGASNVLATVSKSWSIPVTIFDIGKGALMVWIAQLMGLGIAQQAVVGVAAIIGHDWPVFLRFQGGRGILTSLGVIAMLSPWLGLIGLAIPYLFFAPFRQLSLGVTFTLALLPVLSWFAGRPLSISEPMPVTLGMFSIFFVALFRRLTVPRRPISASVSTGELIINRFLFDRDIRDRETWLNQNRAGAGPTGEASTEGGKQEKP
ncbi:MAG: glycerol-3-phosphate acyltransferase [Chloroflexota bacterium]